MSKNIIESTLKTGRSYTLKGDIDFSGTINQSGTLKVGGTAVTSSAAELNILDGATLDVNELNKLDGVTATTAELNLTDNMPATATLSPAAGASNVCLVTITVKDAAGVAMAASQSIEVWLSDAATGIGLTGTTASGAVAAGAAGTDMFTYTSKKHLKVQTSATGVYILSITDSAKTGFYVCAKLPGRGNTQVSAQLVSDNYGA